MSTSLRSLFLCSLLLAASSQAQEQGQYRSKILLDPLGEMGKGSEMSVAELEAQIDSIEQPYARSSAGRFLARHYVQQGDYDSAVAYYRQALAARGLADVANREMLRELAQVYLLKEDYQQAARTLQRALDIDLVPEATDFLLLAQAQYRLGNYVAVVAALDGIAAHGLKLDTGQLRQALALYYRAGAFEQSAAILRQLLQLEPDHAEHWHHLAAVYLQQNKQRLALDTLTLAQEKRIPFTAEQLLLLVDLQAATGNPYGAATTLQQAMADGGVPATSMHQRKLFELWLQARERKRAIAALRSAARSSGDTELYLYLAQLQAEDRQWQQVEETVLSACAAPLADRYVSRANLLLGLSQLKRDRLEAARRLFINATLVGGANAQAAQWLQFMEAAPATEEELRRVVGPCYDSRGKKVSLAALSTTTATPAPVEGEEVASASAAPVAEVALKTVEALRFYTSTQEETLEQLLPRVRSLAVGMNVSLVKAGGTANGPLSVLSLPEENALRLAMPVRGAPQARGRYDLYNAPAFKCAWIRIPQAEQQPLQVVSGLRERVIAAGYELTGEYRLLFLSDGEPGVEVQLGVR